MPEIVNYWKRFGERIGNAATAQAPPDTGSVAVRTVHVRPALVASVVPKDVNIIVQRLEPLPRDEQFDLIVATDVLVYYDVFEQSLALSNVARMLRPAGLFLTNTALFELPAAALTSVGYADIVYLSSIQTPSAIDSSGIDV